MIDAEHALDPSWAKKLGVNLDELLVSQPDTGEQALEICELLVRSNAVNADRIKSGLLTDTMVKSRAKARGVSEAAYMQGNLLNREVTAEDVAQAFVDLALAEKSTGAILTVDGGNIAAALR